MILAIESATPRASVALVSRGAVVGEVVLPAGRQASETFLSGVSELLAAAGGASGDVSCVAVSAGPGSFTGLRVGMAAAKGLCFGWGVPLAPVPTLSALAFRFPGEGRVLCPVLDARKKEVYAALFRWEGDGLVRLVPDMALPPSLLPGRLPPGPVLFCGDGVGPYGALFRERLGERATLAEGPPGLPSAGAVGILGERLFREGAVSDPRSPVPAYVRPSEAEFRRLAASGPGAGTVS